MSVVGLQDIENVEPPTATSVTGNKLANHTQGSVGADTLAGGEGTDSLFGLNGNDDLDGGIGNDVLEDGNGADKLRGGEGAGLLLYRLGNSGDLNLIGDDIVVGSVSRQDRIDISDLLRDLNIDNEEAFSGGYLKLSVVRQDMLL
jgi:Ca2+-binding RTX toxin-like protein